MRLARPDAVLFFVVPGDELHVWDTPDKTALLVADGVPSLHLSGQGYDMTGQDVTETVGAWLRGLS